MNTKAPKEWTRTNDYYNRAVVKSDVYSRRIGRANVYVVDGLNYMYTCSCGANSDLSYSGSLPYAKNIDEAMQFLDTLIPNHLAS